MKLDAPLALLLLVFIPLLLYGYFYRRRRVGLRFSSTAHAGHLGRSLRQRLAHLPILLRALALVLLTVAIARPQEGKELVRDTSKGVAIEMVVDRSGSMGAEMVFRDQKINRLETVKSVFRDFVNGNGRQLPGRPNDLIGMISFARYAETVCPLTLAHGALDEFLKTVHLARHQNEDGTAIGDALALAAARLKNAEQTLAQQIKETKVYQIKSKVIILLTDGQNNFGKRSPLAAAKLAKEWDIKIYAIGIGGEDAYTTISTPLGEYKIPAGPGSGVDDAALRQIADITGGIYRRADTGEGLVSIYQEIDRLETSEIESLRYLDYRELFMPWALAALSCLLAATILSSTVLRRIP